MNNDMQSNGPIQRVELPLKKKLLYALLSVLLFFVAIELILSLANVPPVSESPDPFVGLARTGDLFAKQIINGRTMMVTATNKLHLFNSQQFPAKKEEGTYRIFCVGGSTTYGRPYGDSTSFCGWLREFLAEADPARKWEVINAGGISYASYRVTAIMEELSAYGPDMFVVYSGHNEFLEERTYRELRKVPEPVLWLSSQFAKTRLSTVMQGAYDYITRREDSQTGRDEFEVDEILNDTVGPTSYTRNDTLRSNIVAHFGFNLSRMVKIASVCDSRILFIMPASNLKDMAPFKSEHRHELSDEKLAEWTLHYGRGAAALEAGDAVVAAGAWMKAAAIDSRYADLHYRLGTALLAQGGAEEAKRAFRRAIDEDILPLRIITELRDSLTNLTLEENVPLLDAEAMLEGHCRSEYGRAILGKEYFLDHVHFTIDANRLLALLLLDHLGTEDVLATNSRLSEKSLDAVTSRVRSKVDARQHAVALRNLGNILDWAGRLKEGHRLLSLAHRTLGDAQTALALGRSSTRMGDLPAAADHYREALRLDPGAAKTHFRLADTLERLGRMEESERHYAEMLRLMPGNAKRHSTVGAFMARAGRRDKARYHFGQAFSIDPCSAEALLGMARIEGDSGDVAQAASWYRKLVVTEPDSVTGHLELGKLLAETGQLDEAASHLQKAVTLAPHSDDAHYNLATALMLAGNAAEAEGHYRKTLQINPDSAKTLVGLGAACSAQGRHRQAIPLFEHALQLEPDLIEAHHDLAVALNKLGKVADAERHFGRAKKLMREEPTEKLRSGTR